MEPGEDLEEETEAFQVETEGKYMKDQYNCAHRFSQDFQTALSYFHLMIESHMSMNGNAIGHHRSKCQQLALYLSGI